MVESVVAVLSQSCIVGQEMDGEFDDCRCRWLVEIENLLSESNQSGHAVNAREISDLRLEGGDIVFHLVVLFEHQLGHSGCAEKWNLALSHYLVLPEPGEER